MDKILIRFDDICPTMNIRQWQRAEEVLRKYNVKPLLGIVPDNVDEELMIDPPMPSYWEYIKRLQKDGYKIAMHGYRHQYDIKHRGIINRGKNSEFAGHPYEIQYEKIKRGKEILLSHGIDTDTFFAPSHSYDLNTLRALAANGFKYMSDGKTRRPIVRKGVLCVPSSFSSLAKYEKPGCKCVVFHTNEWTRNDKKSGYDNLVYVCSKYNNSIVDFQSYVEQEKGNIVLESVYEKARIMWEYKLRDKISRIYHFLIQK